MQQQPLNLFSPIIATTRTSTQSTLVPDEIPSYSSVAQKQVKRAVFRDRWFQSFRLEDTQVPHPASIKREPGISKIPETQFSNEAPNVTNIL